ncbi:unnamed protein product [Angiostrongylus costaricensis]|uniref:G domain-containing protein n=1 Tax=Angiostrongylus costaricensis TaxID=334426 RepID=A0A0R3PS75_ANGCS|nr:unnamed protein product [Angiostrongylus costaricensis]
MEEMFKLRQLSDEVAAAQERQRVLTMQVKRERAEIESLRLLKQQNLAREAAAAVLSKLRSSPSDGNWISTDWNSGSFCDCSEKVVISPNPYQRSSMESIYEEETVKISLVAENQLRNGNIIGTTENVDMIMPENEVVKGFSSNPNIRKVIVGGRQAATNEDKMVLLFGPIGSGKTSTINSMLNYLYDVKKENNFRFVLDYPVKKTNTLTVYVINNTILPFRVTIIDTPGIVDEKDDKAVSTLIKKWFEKELREAGTVRVDAISLVLSHNENSLGWPFINELASVKHMLGDDLKTNVLPIITNSEVHSLNSDIIIFFFSRYMMYRA